MRAIRLLLLLKALSVFTFLLITYSCDTNMKNDPNEIVFPDSNVSYISHVYPLMRFTCAAPGCHNQYDRVAGLVLDDYFDMMFSLAGAMVMPYKPNESVLVQIIEERLPHYPPIYLRMNDNHKRGIKTWISEGARNN